MLKLAKSYGTSADALAELVSEISFGSRRFTLRNLKRHSLRSRGLGESRLRPAPQFEEIGCKKHWAVWSAYPETDPVPAFADDSRGVPKLLYSSRTLLTFL